jgi:hypothetical protein
MEVDAGDGRFVAAVCAAGVDAGFGAGAVVAVHGEDGTLLRAGEEVSWICVWEGDA